MVAANITIAIIIIVLFVVLTAVGFAIYFLNTGFSRLGRRGGGSTTESDEEALG